MNILIVDDSATVKSMLRMVIQKELPEATVIECNNGKEAFSKMKSKGFALIITDLEMESGDGGTFVAKMQGNAILKKKKIIIFTSKPETVENIYGPTVKVVSKMSGVEKIKEAILESLGKKKTNEDASM